MNFEKVELDKKCWVDKESKKEYIVIHSSNSRTNYSPTAGKKESAKDVVTRWASNKERFSTPFLINRDGTIIQTFPDECWSYHLNIPNSHGAYDRSSIGIELVNELGLVKQGSRYYIQNIVNHQNEYLGPRFTKLYRKYEHWADLSLPQVASLISLIKFLTEKHSITPKFFNNTSFDPGVWNKANIFTHANVNKFVNDLPFNEWVSKKLVEEFSGTPKKALQSI